MENENQGSHRVKISGLSEDDLTFPVDKIAARKLISPFTV
jgi:hypothetical protein